jgi:SAM-dependent methyltransferase
MENIMSNVSAPDPFLDDIDWVRVWRERKLRQLSTPHFLNSIEFWSDKENVKRLYLSDGNGRKEHIKEQIAGMEIQAGARVLDIGAGPGTLAVPLAKMGCEVTVIEPSQPMIAACREYQERQKVNDIHYINKQWQDVTIDEMDGPFDVVIASYSLSMIEIGEAVRKMDLVCCGSVYLFWFMTPLPSAKAMHDLWPEVHGAPHYYEPMADCLFNALLQMGIYPNVEVSKSSHAHRYVTIGDAVADFHRRMGCSDSRQDKIIGNYLRTHLCAAGKEFQLRGSSRSAKIWWSKESSG